jgi:molybdenum cofactor synthesis domain-containing protein
VSLAGSEFSPAAAVVVVSDGVAAGEREDRSGALCVELLRELGFACAVPTVVPDDRDTIAAELRRLAATGAGLVVTTGGTGFGPRDVTPEATRAVIEREAPGMAEAVRAASAPPFGMLSRGVAGVVGITVIVNLPGSTGGVRDGVAALGPGLRHAVDLARGSTTAHPPPASGRYWNERT